MSHVLTYRAGSLQRPHLPFPRIADIGIQGLELVWNDQTSVDAVEAALQGSGLRITSINPSCPLDDDNLARNLGRYAEHAAALGAAYLFVSAKAGDMPRQEAYDRLRRVGDAVGEHQVYLAMETHPDLCQNADNMLATMAAVDHPWVGVNYDTANIYFYNRDVDTVQEAKKAAAHIRGVHVKDTMGGFEDWNFPVFGEGIVDFAAVGEVFDQSGFTGPYCMELEGGIFNTDDADELVAKVKGCADHLRQVGLVD